MQFGSILQSRCTAQESLQVHLKREVSEEEESSGTDEEIARISKYSSTTDEGRGS
jgi:hypothetical protein